MPSEEWTRTLSASEADALTAAAVAVRGRDDLASISPQEARELLGPELTEVAQMIREECASRGFVLVRGLEVDGRVEDACAAFYLLGHLLGDPVTQNARGHLLGHVKDIGSDPTKPETRIYQTSKAQPYHTDSCDIVGLACLAPAKQGGLSNVTSSATVYNEVLKRRPDLIEVLEEPFFNDRKGEVPEGKEPWFEMPVFCRHAGELNSMHDRSFIDAAQARFPELPRLTPKQVEALDLVDSLASDPEIRLDMKLVPGDMQFIHNHQIFHARSEYTDFAPGEGRQRHLLRLWLSLPDGRELPPVFAERYGEPIARGSVRGGIKVPGSKPCVPFEAA